MPVISMFYGIIIYMYNMDNKKHHDPHIHAQYQDDTAVVNFTTCEVLEGSLPGKQMRLLLAWIEIHRDELTADWQLAVNGRKVFRIKPLD